MTGKQKVKEITNVSKRAKVATLVATADTVFRRMKGLLGRKTIERGEALIITPCQSIHMLFMKFPIDVIFIDSKGIVVGLCAGIQPFKFSPFFSRAHSAIETAVGAIQSSQTRVGDCIQFHFH